MNEKEKLIAKKNKQKIKQYKKQLKSEMFDVDNELKYNENGEVVIECKIGKAENIFNKYDLAQDRTITDEFEKYLMDEVEIIPMSENVALKLYVDESFTNENERQVKKSLKRHFSFNITTDKVKMRKNAWISGILYALGLICLILCPFVSMWLKEYPLLPIYESLLVFTWFFLWEGFGLTFFDRGKLRQHRYNMLRLYNASITFKKSQIISSNLPEHTARKVEEKHAKKHVFKGLFSKNK